MHFKIQMQMLCPPRIKSRKYSLKPEIQVMQILEQQTPLSDFLAGLGGITGIILE